MEPGDPAKDFTAPAHTGDTFRLADALAHGPVVLFFYPKAYSPGCRIEVSHFQARWEEFRALSASLAGVSLDAPELQARFAADCSVDFPLLSDQDGKICALYGLKRFAGIILQRATFVIAADGRVVSAIRNPLNMKAHADGALRALSESRPATDSSGGAR